MVREQTTAEDLLGEPRGPRFRVDPVAQVLPEVSVEALDRRSECRVDLTCVLEVNLIISEVAVCFHLECLLLVCLILGWASRLVDPSCLLK